MGRPDHVEQCAIGEGLAQKFDAVRLLHLPLEGKVKAPRRFVSRLLPGKLRCESDRLELAVQRPPRLSASASTRSRTLT